MCAKIVAIGGGEIGRQKIMPDGSIKQYPIETLEIEQEIVCLSGKEHPKLLLLPTASHDSVPYFEAVQNHFGKRLGCECSVLYVSAKPSLAQMQDMVANADIVYVGGGSTDYLMDTWRACGLDKILIESSQRDVVLSGVSAGANCWFKHYCTWHSTGDEGHFALGQGLGLIDGLCVPHCLTRPQGLTFGLDVCQNTADPKVLYALDDYTALVWEDGLKRAVISQLGKEMGAKVRQISCRDGVFFVY